MTNKNNPLCFAALIAFVLCLFSIMQLINQLLKQGFPYGLMDRPRLLITILVLSLFLYYYARNNMSAWYIVFLYMLIPIPLRFLNWHYYEHAYFHGIKQVYLFMLIDILICIYLLYKYRPYKEYTRDLINKYCGE